VHTIRVLRSIKFVSIRRNEIYDKVPVRSGVFGWMKDSSAYVPYYADSAGRGSPYGENRVQRHTLALRDVAYLINGEPRLTAKAHAAQMKRKEVDEFDSPQTVEKYLCMFRRRLEKGQCFQQPYLGLREFVARFEPPIDGEQPDADPILASNEYPLGRMFYDYDYRSDGDPVPLFADAVLRCGELNVDEIRHSASSRP
jgi:CRISPR-associated protein Cas5d